MLTLNILAQDVMYGGVYAYQFTENLQYAKYIVDKKEFITNKLEFLKTYDLDINTFEIITKTNESALLYFLNGNIIKIEQDSEFRIDMFSITLKDVPSYPSKITVDCYSMNIALMEGEAYFSIFKNNTNDQVILQTPLTNLGLETGKYYIQSNKKSILIYILDGSLDVYDNVTNKKQAIQANNAVLIHPAPALSLKQLEIFADKMTTSVKKAKVGQFSSYLEVVKEFDKLKNEVIFVRVDNRIVGINIK